MSARAWFYGLVVDAAVCGLVYGTVYTVMRLTHHPG